MTNKRILTLITLLLFLLLVVGCDWPWTINKPPEIKSAPVETATVGVDYTYNVVATDPDGDALTYSLTTEPEGMLIGVNSGKITWKADDITAAGVGDYDVIVVVKDEGGLSDSQDFTITVSEFVIELVGIEVEPKEMTLPLDGIGAFEVTANYNDDSTDVVTSVCVYGIDDTSIAEVYVVNNGDTGVVTALKVGTATISISYTDDEDITEGTTLTVIVGDTITINWLEDATRYNADDSYHSAWIDDPLGPATLIQDDGGWCFADVREYYNIWAPDVVEGSIVISATGLLTGYATYFLNFDTEDVFTGQIEIVVHEDGTSEGTMVGTYTQNHYKFGTEAEVEGIYGKAIECTDEEGKWFVGHTDYIAHE